MKINYLEKELSLTGNLARNSMNGLAELVKGIFTRPRVHEDKVGYWQLILLQSEANGCFYDGDELPYSIWAWPKDTWFQERLSHHLKVCEIAAHHVKK
jgi:hypothetical protein